MKGYKSQTWLVGSAVTVLMAGCITITRTPRETDLGSHHIIVVPDCQDAATHSERHYESDGSSKVLFYEFTCGQTTMRLDGNALTVNGKSYGSLNEGDTIAVNYRSVRVNSMERAAK
jgi:hypothetical protein